MKRFYRAYPVPCAVRLPNSILVVATCPTEATAAALRLFTEWGWRLERVEEFA